MPYMSMMTGTFKRKGINFMTTIHSHTRPGSLSRAHEAYFDRDWQPRGSRHLLQDTALAAGKVAAIGTLGSFALAAGAMTYLIFMVPDPARANVITTIDPSAKQDVYDLGEVTEQPYSDQTTFDLTQQTAVDIESITFDPTTRFDNGATPDNVELDKLTPATAENAATWSTVDIASITGDPKLWAGGYLTGNVGINQTLAAGRYRLDWDVWFVNTPTVGNGLGVVPTMAATFTPLGGTGGGPVNGVSPAPEASTWAMLGLGFAAMAWVGVRRHARGEPRLATAHLTSD
jgi:hypothetical protein